MSSYDARGHFEEPHTNRRIGCGTIEVDNYLRAIKKPGIVQADLLTARMTTPSARQAASVRSCSAKKKISTRCSGLWTSPTAMT